MSALSWGMLSEKKRKIHQGFHIENELYRCYVTRGVFATCLSKKKRKITKIFMYGSYVCGVVCFRFYAVRVLCSALWCVEHVGLEDDLCRLKTILPYWGCGGSSSSR